MIDAPPMTIAPGIQNNQIHMAIRPGSASRAIGNIAFFGEPVRVEEIIEAYLEGNALTPRPFLNLEQRARAANIRSAFVARTGHEFDIVNRAGLGPRPYYWIIPEMQRSIWSTLTMTGNAITGGNFFAMLAFSCVESAQRYIRERGYLAEFTPALRNHLTAVGYRLFIDGTFVFYMNEGAYNDLRYVLNTHGVTGGACAGCGEDLIVSSNSNP